VRKAILLFASVVMMSATAFAGTAHAITGVTAPDTINYKYVGVTGPDSGTCGPTWANDKVTRTFKVYKEQAINGSYEVLEAFTYGTFITVQGPSPESCEAGNSHNVNANVHGSFYGSEILYVSSTNKSGNWLASTDVACSATCNTSEWMTNAFGAGAVVTTADFWFSYRTAAPLTCAKHWINAAYGNSGDIATSC
jgi:hypothetical protein